LPDPPTPSLKDRVWRWLDTHPTLPFAELHAEYPAANWKAGKIRAEKDAKKRGGGKRSHLAPGANQVTNPAPPPNSPKNSRENLDHIPSWDELQRLALARLIGAEDKSFAPMLALIMKYFPPPKSEASSLVPLAWDWAAPKQLQLRDAALMGNVNVCGNRQECGKTSTLACAWVQMNEGSPAPYNLNYINTSQDKSREIVRNLMIHPRSVFRKFGFATRVGDWQTQQMTLKNGATFTINPSKGTSAAGLTAEIVWVDDVNSAFDDKKEAVIGLSAPQVVTLPHGHLWYSSNNASGAYRNFRDGISKLESFTTVEFFPGDVPQNQQPGKSGDVGTILELTMGEEARLAQMENIDVNTQGEWFNPDHVAQAFTTDPATFPESYEAITVGVDLGFEHPTSLEAFGRAGTQVFEVEAWQVKHLSPTEIVFKVEATWKRLTERFHGKRIIVYVENQAGGLGIAKDLQRHGIPCVTSNFVDDLPKAPMKGDPSAVKSLTVPKAFVIGTWQKLLGDYLFHGFSKPLQQELLRYCGDKVLDDAVDAGLHALYPLVLNQAFRVSGTRM
jgi:hypothetical protein